MNAHPGPESDLRQALLHLAYWHLERGHLHKSETLSRGLLTLDPGCGEAWYYLGASLRRRGHISDAAQAFVQATQLGDHRPEVWLALAEAKILCGDARTARAAIAQVTRALPKTDRRFRRACALLRMCPPEAVVY
ncbi:hypothetical protein DL240_13625 [Lujinxingia litoralis]|uniref:Uncharacterized protein n=1 Tax=Lujinxingia litoralis TaxID=2211119 RepID=A0A328C3J7_9DELT|nr:tetratricopeptide repeat protein [Lujinxingia litoralis]RAL21168.1 hypothetical protein DL240_13625 [Lujinxingia litoralis]